jgi:hypothetical protein
MKNLILLFVIALIISCTKTETKADAVLTEASTIESSLKSTVSLSVLEEKTALYVKV